MRANNQAEIRSLVGTPGIRPEDVSIVVPVGGDISQWERCKESLRQLDPAPGEIIVVVDGSETDAGQPVTIGATVLTLEHRAGPAAARNHGARRAAGSVLFFVDSDVELPPDIISRLVSHFGTDDGPAAVIGSYDDAPGAAGFLSQYRNLLHHYVHQNSSSEASTFWGACGAVRREIFLAIGGFDERFRKPSVEDIELGRRLCRAGHRILLDKTLQVKHLKTWRIGSMLSTDLFRRAVPWTELMLQEGKLPNDLNVKTRDRISVAMAFLMPVTAAAALWWSPLLIAVALMMVILVTVNAGLVLFFARRRGWVFVLGALPWYWVYLLTCGLGFAIGMTRHGLNVL